MSFKDIIINQFLDYFNNISNNKLETIFVDSPKKMEQQLDISDRPIFIFNFHLIFNIIPKFQTGNYIFLLFKEHGIGFLVNICNIRHCSKIIEIARKDEYKAIEDSTEVIMLLKTPIVDLTYCSKSLHTNKLLSIFDKLLTDKYYTYDRDEKSIAFYREIGFDVDKHICLDIEPYNPFLDE